MLDRAYRLILDDSPEAILIESRDRVAYLNNTYARLLGYRSSRELATVTVRDIAIASDQERLVYYGRCRQQGKPAPAHYEFRVHRRDGSMTRFGAHVWATWVSGELLISTIVRETVIASAERSAVEETNALSPRELQVFHRLLAGCRSKEIALELGISEKTVGTHRIRIYQKLSFRSDLDLFRFAAEKGLLTT